MRQIVLIFFCLGFFKISLSQKTTVKGRIIDSVINKPLAFSTISIVHTTDSTLVSFTRADSVGFFKLNAIEKGNYLLSVSYVGYAPVWKPVEVLGTNAVQDIGDINLQDIKLIGNVIVNAKRPPVVINNDTLEFNAENFKTQPNAVVEDMLKKMPGVTIDKDGTVKVNGQVVKRILVNGKEFFTGDVKIATQNLPADAVDKVQVFDKQSDQSSFTGIDDGNSEKTINLKLKKDRDHAVFGKLTGGAGNESRYDAQANINKFHGNEQLSFLGMSNNTNRQGFELTDVLNFTGEFSKGMRGGGGTRVVIRTDDDGNEGSLPITGLGQKQQGIANTTAGGINYNNLWNKEKTDWSSNYLFNNIHLATNRQVNIQNILPGNSFTRFENSNTTNDNTQHRINIVLDQKIDSSFSIKISPSVTWQHANKKSFTQYNAATTDNIKLNDGYSNTSTTSDAFNFNSDFLFRKKFKKKGRTISLSIYTAYNHSSLNGTLFSKNTFYNANENGTDSLINQINSRDAVTKTLASTLIYTEPIGKRSLLELKSYLNANNSKSDKQTYDYNVFSGKHDLLNTLLSNNYKNNYDYYGGGLSFRTNPKKANITLGISLQDAVLKGQSNSFLSQIHHHFIDALPTAIIQYNFTRMKNMRFEYSTSTLQPTIVQLQPVGDISDPLNISKGNPNLKRQYDHNIQFNFFSAHTAKQTNLFSFINFTASENAIVRSDSVLQNGTRITSFTNTNGIYNFFGNVEYGFPLKKLKSRIEFGNNINFYKNASFINLQRNAITTFSLGPNVDYNFTLDDKITIDASARLSINHAKYSLQELASNNYLQQDYNLDITNYFTHGFILNNQFNYILNTGRADGFNTKIPLWNASFAKTFLKNKRGEIKLSVQDILNKNTGITRSNNFGYIVDEKYNVLQRYFLLSFTYNLNKSTGTGGAKAVIKTFNN